MSIETNLLEIKNEIEQVQVTLVAVSKTKSVEEIKEAYDAGQRIFGENQVQELVEKHPALPQDIFWHMIGHLQTNKVKYIAPFVHLIQSVDSLKLLKEIDKNAKKHNRVIDCLLQIHIAEEESKFGLSHEEVIELLRSGDYQQMQNIRIVGLMGIATNTENGKVIKEEFYELKTFFDGLKISFFKEKDYFNILSMGMSSDYRLAITQGSNMIRLGSGIFGSRANKQ
ncbi:YggS family pyridoxal phosphate-dependent enzyme [Olivibacter sitiensis]|uniref:YggS family pyridoxal phosphate-dependent enzyme n=1 Tax=Olivibacter sitiensis TaxID=376470 RepID=UPI00042134E8|nr:YggS family pyridoxal phosphate-dependent enzyme [Olivibacter sitiensis]